MSFAGVQFPEVPNEETALSTAQHDMARMLTVAQEFFAKVEKATAEKFALLDPTDEVAKIFASNDALRDVFYSLDADDEKYVRLVLSQTVNQTRQSLANATGHM